MGSMMADLKGVHAGINMYHRSNGTPELSIDDLLVKLFQEVEYVWPKLGYPPLVTPFSQYVKNVALMNVYNMERGEGRWQAIDSNTWDMILGKAGRLPGELDPEIVALAKEKGYEFTDVDPQTNYPDKLDEYLQEMTREGWDFGQDDEELFELAMHDRQYRDYKSGVAKERFYADLNKLKDAKMAEQGLSPEDIKAVKRAKYVAVTAPASGQVFWDVDMDDRSAMPMEGTPFAAGSQLCFVMTPMSYTERVVTYISGRLREVVVPQGGMVRKGDVIAYLDEVADMLPEGDAPSEKLKRVEETPYVSKPRVEKK